MKILRTAAILVAIVCLSFAAAVGAYVVYDAIDDPPRHGFQPEIFAGDNYAFEADPETGYRHRPNYRGVKRNVYTVGGKTVQIVTPIFQDSMGARVAAANMPKPDEIGLITVGGSQAWGQGVREDETFGAVLAQKLAVSERNFAISGTGGVSSYFQMKRHLDLKPRWIVYGFWEDHLNRNLRYCANTGLPACTPLPRVAFDPTGMPRFVLPKNPGAKIALVRDYLRTMSAGAPFGWRDIVWSYRRLERRLDQALHPEQFDMAPRTRKIEAALFVQQQMAKAARSAGATLVVIFIPLYFSDHIRPAPERLRAAATSDGYIFVDVGSALRRLTELGDAVSLPGDGHLSVAGHRAVAEAAFEAIGGRRGDEKSP